MMMMCYIGYGQDYLMQGNAAFEKGNFTAAIQYYSKYDKLSLNSEILEKRGISYYRVNDLKKAIRDFTNAKKLGNSNPDMYYRMAVIKQNLGDIEEAVFFYKSFIGLVDEEHQKYDRAKIELKNCIYTAFNQANEEVASVQSFGEEVNTAYDEIYPIRSPRYGNVYYLSTNRNQSDFQIMAFSINEKGNWKDTPEIVADVNTAKHDYLQDVSADGNSLLYQKQGAEILDRHLTFSTYNGDEEIKINIPRTVLKDVADLQIVDHNTLAFASDKLSGYGGYDIYTITYKDKKWSEPVNLGPLVNTMYDDRFPHFSDGKKQLYFSSNRPYAFGGFDIYTIDLSVDKKVQNIGQPINTAGDDINYRLDADGHTAIYSSNSKTGTGGYDLYFAHMREPKNLQPRDSLRFEYIDEILRIEDEKKKTQLIAEQEKQKAKKEAKEKADALRKKQLEEEKKAAEIAALEKAELEKKQNQLAAAEQLKKDLLIQERQAKEEATKKAEEVSVEKEKSDEMMTTSASKTLDEVSTDKSLITKGYKTKKLKAIDSYIIYYQDRQDLLNDKNKEIVHAIAYYLSENPKEQIRLLVYTDEKEPGLPEFVQYNTLLRAKTISDYLVDLGIDPDRIHIESLAANYPVAKEDVAGQSNTEYAYLNKRIETQIISDNGKLITDHRVDPGKMPLAYRDRRYILFQDIRDELYYSVKVGSTPRIFKNAILRFYDDIYVRKESGTSDNDYYIGVYTKYADAKALQEKLKKSTAPITEIVPFFNGKKVESVDIDALSAEYPDLSNYTKN